VILSGQMYHQNIFTSSSTTFPSLKLDDKLRTKKDLSLILLY